MIKEKSNEKSLHCKLTHKQLLRKSLATYAKIDNHSYKPYYILSIYELYTWLFLKLKGNNQMLNIPQNKLNDAVKAMNIAELLVTEKQLSYATPHKIYRCGTVHKPKSKNAWFKVLHDGSSNFITIVYGNHEHGSSEKYHININDTTYRSLTTVERKELQKKTEQIIVQDRERQAQEIAAKREKAIKAYNSFRHCDTHPYLERKGIQHPQNYQFRIDNRYDNNNLAIPFVDSTGQIQGYQTIDIDGTKRFNGRTGGNYWRYPMTNPCSDVFDDSNSFFILCEGVATGLSAYEAITGYFDTQVYLPIVLCAFNAGNLSKVINATKAHKLPYLLLVDNDYTKAKNSGVETAKAIIEEHPDAIIYPIIFNNGDANDFIVANGEAEFIKLFQSLPNPLTNPYINSLPTKEV